MYDSLLFLIPFGLFYLVLVIIAARVGRRRGRTMQAILLTLFLGIPGLLIVLFMSPKDKPAKKTPLRNITPAPRPRRPVMLDCPGCGAPVREGAARCPYCGAHLGWE